MILQWNRKIKAGANGSEPFLKNLLVSFYSTCFSLKAISIIALGYAQENSLNIVGIEQFAIHEAIHRKGCPVVLMLLHTPQ